MYLFVAVLQAVQMPRFYWHKFEGRKDITFEETPFSVADAKVLDCQFGTKYFKQRPLKGKRLWLQGTRKIGCQAHVEVKTFTLYPDFAVRKGEKEGLSKWRLQCLQEERINSLRTELAKGQPVQTLTKYFISLPSEEAHSGHPNGQPAVYGQKLHPLVAQKIAEMVAAGIVDTTEVKRSLKYYVNNFLSKEIGKTPLEHDRAFYPTNDDIRNHVGKAKRTLELSRFDQENLRLKVEKWQKSSPQSSFFFRPFRTHPGRSDCHQPEEEGQSLAEEDESFEETLLYVHQEDWQKELLTRYGNTLTLIDATYKTMFFLCVKTNVSYTVVAEFIIQSETSNHILEALSMIKSWNPSWEPEYFMMDYSDAEMAAVRDLFPSTQIYLCEFHREQARERWVKERRHGQSDIEASTLLDLLRDCASAPPNWNLPDQSPDYYFQRNIQQLHSSGVWKGNQHVQQWLNTSWLNCPKVSRGVTRIFRPRRHAP